MGAERTVVGLWRRMWLLREQLCVALFFSLCVILPGNSFFSSDRGSGKGREINQCLYGFFSKLHYTDKDEQGFQEFRDRVDV